MSGAFWRVAGFSYLRYANICANFLRQAVKEGPVKENLLKRTSTQFGIAEWKNGVKGTVVSQKNIGVSGALKK